MNSTNHIHCYIKD